MRPLLPIACLALFMPLVAFSSALAHAADLDTPPPPIVYDPLQGQYPPPPPPPPAPPAPRFRLEVDDEVSARELHSPYPNPYFSQVIPLPSRPYAPTFFGHPLSPPNYGYGY